MESVVAAPRQRPPSGAMQAPSSPGKRRCRHDFPEGAGRPRPARSSHFQGLHPAEPPKQRTAPPYRRLGGHMAAPSLISTRRFSATTRLRLQVLFARAWEALADAYQAQAAEFVRRLKHQLPIDEALDRFFREVGVPAAMNDTVRARALIALASMIEEAEEPDEASEPGWNPLRP